MYEIKDHENIQNAINGLEIFIKAINNMTEEESDYVYSKMAALDINCMKIDVLTYNLKKDE
jgi:hypothetical protein